MYNIVKSEWLQWHITMRLYAVMAPTGDVVVGTVMAGKNKSRDRKWWRPRQD